jgi:hypothetical protein
LKDENLDVKKFKLSFKILKMDLIKEGKVLYLILIENNERKLEFEVKISRK